MSESYVKASREDYIILFLTKRRIGYVHITEGILPTESFIDFGYRP